MQFLSTLSLLASIAALTSAAPTTDQPAKLASFYLKTQVTKAGSPYNGLYLTPYHTGAGTNAARLVSSSKGLPKSYLNGTELYFNLGKGSDDQYPTQFIDNSLSDGWGILTINVVSKGASGYSINSNNHLIPPTYVSGSGLDIPAWRACDWNHGGPELFWNNFESDDISWTTHVPATCSLVNVIAEYS